MIPTAAPPPHAGGPPAELTTRADTAIEEILTAVLYERVPVTLAAAPPGAGKTFLVETVVSLAVLHEGDRVAVAVQTNAQGLDLLQRLATAFPLLPLIWHARADLPPPVGLHVQHAPRARDIPPGPCVVIANSAKLALMPRGEGGPDPFDLLVVDEAYQMTDVAYVQIAGLADQHLLVGDPGQIPPVVSADVTRWRSDPAGPHQPAPQALQQRRPNDVRRIDLPATRRLGADTVQLIQPAFYPGLPFGSLRQHRMLRFTNAPGAAGELLSGLNGTEIVMGELPAAYTGEHDPRLAAAIAATVGTAMRHGQLSTPEGQGPLRPEQIAVVCAHVAQVGLVQAALAAGGADAGRVTVDTAERLQGREAELVIAWHPASGMPEVSDFARAAGRMCVMASRHRAGCVLIGRHGIREALDRAGSGPERVLGIDDDPGLRGWRANRGLLEALERRAHILRLPG